jgi:hypothetical protein
MNGGKEKTMPNGKKFPGQVLSVWLEKEADRERLVKVLRAKYQNQLGFSSYAKLAIYQMLEKDEATTAEECKKSGRGAVVASPARRRAENDVNHRATNPEVKHDRTRSEEGGIPSDGR